MARRKIHGPPLTGSGRTTFCMHWRSMNGPPLLIAKSLRSKKINCIHCLDGIRKGVQLELFT